MGLDLRLSPGPRAPAEARRTVADSLGDLRPDLVAKLRLLVSELVTNSVRHAGLAEEDRIRITAERDDERVRVAVADPGGRFTPSPPGGRAPPSGWGLFLVDRLADRWGVEANGQTRVWFELDC